jgi:hypothetical protein
MEGERTGGSGRRLHLRYRQTLAAQVELHSLLHQRARAPNLAHHARATTP